MAWWANLQIDALKEAKELWTATLLQADPTSDRNSALGTGQSGSTRDPAAKNTVGRVSP